MTTTVRSAPGALRKTLLIATCALGCAPPASVPAGGGAKIRKLEALGALMKNEINPSFSRLVFLLAHADSMGEDTRAVRAELDITGINLRTAIGKLHAWHDPPTESEQGREVFLTYAASIDDITAQMLDAIDRDDRKTALDHLETIADTCNNCHHFFRLDIEDSLVSRADASRTKPMLQP